MLTVRHRGTMVGARPPVATTFGSPPTSAAQALHDAVHHAGVPEEEAALHRLDGVAADGGPRHPELHPAQGGGGVDQRLLGDPQAGGDGPADVGADGSTTSKLVEVPKSTLITGAP